uniref:PBZ-type domain-containing protein n=1 Tax=Glossina morsitans morsitans TaxID=37546 RepID=A0A1B0FM08_GLOMM
MNMNTIESTNNAHTDNSASQFSPAPVNRSSCTFGVKCYRKNPSHRLEFAHPGDDDFKLHPLPQADANAPDCKYGKNCYRFNPLHYQQFKHPSDINVEDNYKNYYVLKKRRRAQTSSSQNDHANFGDESDESDEEDPFGTESDDSDYVPSDTS